MKKINEIIKDFREDNDFSQGEVAKYLKIPRSTYGHYPYAITEGARMRCATIASNVGGIPYIIEHGVTGLLFEPQNAEALGTCMIRLAESRAMRAQLGENLYEKASREFSIDATVGKQLEIYEKLETRMTFLASTGSVAPLLGLFGTVWGIMDAFNAIGATQSTNIAAVAPGVAEALFTTAVGLIAAIPAVIAYNKLTNDIDRMTQRMERFAGELGAILSRQLEQTEE